MKISYVPLATLIGFGLLVGCGVPMPLTGYYPTTPQNIVVSAQQWDILATTTADRLAAALLTPRTSQPVVLYVSHPRESSEFLRAFNTLLVTRLLDRGFVVTENPSAGVPVAAQVQVVVLNDEIILTTSVTNGERYVTRLSDVYYIDNTKLGQYIAQVPSATRIIEVVGP
jgi:hypothetical protein